MNLDKIIYSLNQDNLSRHAEFISASLVLDLELKIDEVKQVQGDA